MEITLMTYKTSGLVFVRQINNLIRLQYIEASTFYALSYIINFLFTATGVAIGLCHAPLLKICENGVATRVDDIYTREEYPMYTR